MADKSKIVFMHGVYCCGKSTYVDKKFSSREWIKDEWEILSVDDIITELANKDGISHNEAFEKYKQCYIDRNFIRFASLLGTGKNIVIDNPCLTKRLRKTYFDFIDKRKYQIEIVAFTITDEEKWLKRLEKRNNETRTIKKEKALKMKEKAELPSYDEGFDKIILLSNI